MKIKYFLAMLFSGLLTIPVSGQIKMKDLDELKEGAKQASDTIQEVALYLNAGGIAIALFFCVYFVATSHPKAKEYVIAIIAGLTIYLIAVNVIF